MPVIVNGDNLTIESVVDVARKLEKIELSPEAVRRIEVCRELVEKKLRENAIMYGVNTGIGELSEVVLTPEQVEKFQKYLIYSHAAGIGEPASIEDTRAAILSRINVHCNGHSALRLKVVETLAEMLNKGVTPVMCQKGSVGASGDLSPMGQMALVPMGEGEAFYKGGRLPGAEAMKRAGIEIITYQARDGLATINGSNVITGMSCLEWHDADRWLKQSEIAAAMVLEVLNANMSGYDDRLHRVRGHKGAITCAENIRRLTEESEMLAQKGKKVQDAYSLRSTPQAVGTGKDTMGFVRHLIETELNGVSDNPIFFPEDDTVISGANFQGSPIAFATEFMGMTVTTISVLSERRINRLTNPHLSSGLPAFLTRGAGMFSGMMLAQYTAGALVNENRILSHPGATGSIPAAADQEDFVSMGMTSAIKCRDIIENANGVLAIEFLCAAQAADFRRPLKLSPATNAAFEVIRKYSDFLDEDRPLYEDINKLSEVVKKGEILDAVQKVCGELKS
ncbi:MAG TPA: histidine ammonia-lyase [candidate division Zixibacteria bacterium]|nr:histidine ammonia-lyase [candidate division Zixibacteria bacterium]